MRQINQTIQYTKTMVVKEILRMSRYIVIGNYKNDKNKIKIKLYFITVYPRKFFSISIIIIWWFYFFNIIEIFLVKLFLKTY